MNNAELMASIRQPLKGVFTLQQLSALIRSAPRNFKTVIGLDGEPFYATRGERKQLRRAKAIAVINAQRDDPRAIDPKYLHASARARRAAWEQEQQRLEAERRAAEQQAKPKRVRKPKAAHAEAEGNRDVAPAKRTRTKKVAA